MLLFQLPLERMAKSWHEHVQNIFSKTISKLSPVNSGLGHLGRRFGSQRIGPNQTGKSTSLTRHIDLIRFSEDLLWIWDYKPNALVESFASQQVYLYARCSRLPTTRLTLLSASIDPLGLAEACLSTRATWSR
jgi:hypothetical protein